MDIGQDMAYVHEFPVHMLLHCKAALPKSEAFISLAFPFLATSDGLLVQ